MRTNVVLVLTALLAGFVGAQCVDPINSDALQYNLTTDGTLVASSVWDYNHQNVSPTYTGYVTSADGNRGSYYQGNIIDGHKAESSPDFWLGPNNVVNGTLTLKFPVPRVINRVDLNTNATEIGGANFTVQYSTDTSDGFDGNWSAVPSPTSTVSLAHDQSATIAFTQPIQTRYLRVVIVKTSGIWMLLNEVEVFGGDNLGDACDACPGEAGDLANGCPSPADRDNDGVPDASDNCPDLQNAGQADGDNDGVGDVCDICPNHANAGQENSDLSALDHTANLTLITSSVGNYFEHDRTDWVNYLDGNRGNYYTGNMIDGDTAQTPSAIFLAPNLRNDATITLDLVTPKVVGQLLLDNKVTEYSIVGYTAEYSDDSTDGFDGTWQVVPGGQDSGAINSGLSTVIVLDPAVNVRFLRLQLHRIDGTWITLNEFGVILGDPLGDACDACPNDAGQLPDGCPTPPDSDQDGTPDATDNCPNIANADQADADLDGVGDACDNCPNNANPDQTNSDAGIVYNLATDGTLVASSAGSYYDATATGFVNAGLDGNRPNVGYYPGNTVDGNTAATSLNQFLVTAASTTLTYKFPSARVIGRIELLNATPAGNPATQTYTLEYSSDTSNGFDGTWSAVPSGDASGSLLSNENADVLLSPPISTRYLRVVLTRLAGSFLILNELVLYDSDTLGDACDACPGAGGDLPDGCPSPPDSDNDGVPDVSDNCVEIQNADQADGDNDGVGDVCDNCPTTANPGQENGDSSEYDLKQDGTRVASNVGSYYDPSTAYFDSTNGDVGNYYVGNVLDHHNTTSAADHWLVTAAAATLTVKFPAARIINRVVLENQEAAGNAFNGHYTVQSSSDTTDGFDGTWTTVSSSAATGLIGVGFVIDVPLDEPIERRYIRILFTRTIGSFITLNELRVFAGDNPGDACDACPAEAGLLANGCNCAGFCADVKTAVEAALCGATSATSWAQLRSLVDSTMATVLGGGSVCDAGGNAACRSAILTAVGLPE